MADSAFNAREIEAMGHPRAGVLPLVLDFKALRSAPDRRVLRQYRDGLVNVLFVGRCAPNKKIEDLLNAFYYFQRYVQPASRFIHVGSFAGLEQYHALLLARARELQLQHVDLVGTVSQAELNAFYDVSRLFLCLSDHEGFCIPLIEAMTHRLPVLAYAAGAVPETLDGAGVLFREKRFDLIAENAVLYPLLQVITPTASWSEIASPAGTSVQNFSGIGTTGVVLADVATVTA